MGVCTYICTQALLACYYNIGLYKLYCTGVWMSRNGESDEDGCRKDQRTKTHRRDGSASKIDHLWSPSQHDCNRFCDTSYACDFCGALHLENEVGGVVSPTSKHQYMYCYRNYKVCLIARVKNQRASPSCWLGLSVLTSSTTVTGS